MSKFKKLTVGQQLRREREFLNWSQEQLAEEIGTTALSINRWEHNKTLPRPRYRAALCNVFKKSSEILFDLHEGDEEQEAELPAIWNVPHLRNLYFTGRDDVLTYLHDSLTFKKTVALTQPRAISGLGGIGKTQMAVEYAYRYGSAYKAVLWARADSHKTLIADFVALADLLNLPEKDEVDQGRLINAVKGWLETHTHWLLILDNADDLELIYDFLPTRGRGHTLLTTRSQATGSHIKGVELEKMGQFEHVERADLLRRTGREREALLLEERAKVIRARLAEEESLQRDYPILEFDSAPEAILEPRRLITSMDIPEHAVACFFQDVITRLSQQHKAKVIRHLRSEIGTHPIYELDVNGKRLTVFHPGVGAPLAAGILEEVIALGCKKFIACGGAGVLDRTLAIGHPVVPTTAIRDEGTSYHYLPPGREVSASAEGVAALETVLKAHHVEYLLSKTWTTDAIYRETAVKVQRRRAEGCVVVEMEAAAFFAVAQFRGVHFAQLLYGGDDVSGNEWNSRQWDKHTLVREQLFWLAAEACLLL